jgi:hypothetical protein
MGAIGTADRISTEFELLYSISGRKPAIREPTWMDMISSYIIANIILYTYMIYVELCRHTTSLSQTLYVKHGTCVDHIQLEMTELIHAVCGSAKMPLASASLLHSVLDCFKLLWSSCVFYFRDVSCEVAFGNASQCLKLKMLQSFPTRVLACLWSNSHQLVKQY